VPFDFYKSIEVKTGGYPAEFGRATGGVINAVTKSGSNDFKFAVHGNFELDGLREDSPDTYIIANHQGKPRRARAARSKSAARSSRTTCSSTC
jgi:outer membrane receptor protein involved in Fe transport